MLFLKPRIQERGTDCEKYEASDERSLGFRGIFKKIPENTVISTFPEMFKKISENIATYFGKCYQRFQVMFRRIQGEYKFLFIL